MSTAELRNKWIKSIAIVDDKFLRMVDALYETYSKDEIVAYTAQGEALTVESYKREVQKGVDDIKAGRVISDSDLAKEIESW